MNKHPKRQSQPKRPAQAKLNCKSASTEVRAELLADLLCIRKLHTHELPKVGISHSAGRINDLNKRGWLAYVKVGSSTTVRVSDLHHFINASQD